MDNLIYYRLILYVITASTITLVWLSIERLPGNGGRIPLRYLMAALLISNLDTLFGSCLKILGINGSEWVFFGSGLVIILVLMSFIRMSKRH